METLIQSNSLKEHRAHEIIRKTITGILQDIKPLLGPGASDAFIIKNQAPYYTRDGMEVMESLTFDNELSRYIHHILFQAAYNQGKQVGDGTTTLETLYCYLYLAMRDIIEDRAADYKLRYMNLNVLRKRWKAFTNIIIEKLKERSGEMTKEKLLSMFMTCTQDVELSAKLYDQLADPIMNGAYIVPRVSNIASDFQVTTYSRPTFKVTKQFSIKPVEGSMKSAVMFYCNGTLDISHWEVLMSMIGRTLEDQAGNIRTLDMVILCHGTTDRTRQTLKTFNKKIHEYNLDLASYNNLIIYTMDDYRKFDREELSMISTIITEEEDPGTVIAPITFETLLYRTFFTPGTLEDLATGEMIKSIPDLETYDMDLHAIEAMKTLATSPFYITVDAVEGIALDRDLGPNAQRQYNALQKEIEAEKSEVRKVDLGRRMRRIYGMFIDIQVGSVLLKDSQRKFELILDAIISAAEGVRYGVITGNSILTVMDILCDDEDFGPESEYYEESIMLFNALNNVAHDLISNAAPEKVEYNQDDIESMLTHGLYDIIDFNLNADACYWPTKEMVANNPETFSRTVEVPLEEGAITIPDRIIEPLSIMRAILENSILPLEIAKTKVYHISGNMGYMNNFIEIEEDE